MNYNFLMCLLATVQCVIIPIVIPATQLVKAPLAQATFTAEQYVKMMNRDPEAIKAYLKFLGSKAQDSQVVKSS